PAIRYQAYYARAFAYTNMSSPPADQATKARQAALDGLKTVNELKAPANMPEQEFEKQKQPAKILFNYTAANAAMALKDCAGAAESYKAVLGFTPDDAVTNYRLGQAYLCTNPPQQMDAFWSFARAVTAKGANQQQSNQVKSYLRKLIANYQGGNVCDTLTDAE